LPRRPLSLPSAPSSGLVPRPPRRRLARLAPAARWRSRSARSPGASSLALGGPGSGPRPAAPARAGGSLRSRAGGGTRSLRSLARRWSHRSGRRRSHPPPVRGRSGIHAGRGTGCGRL